MTGERRNLTQQAATVLGTISILLGVGLVGWSLWRGMGIHGGGLVSIVLGALAIAAGRTASRASTEGPPR